MLLDSGTRIHTLRVHLVGTLRGIEVCVVYERFSPDRKWRPRARDRGILVLGSVNDFAKSLKLARIDSAVAVHMNGLGCWL